MDFMEEYTIPKKICDDFINYHKKNIEYKRSGSFLGVKNSDDHKKSTDVYFYNHSNSSFIKKFFEYLSKSVQTYCNKYNIGFPIQTYICNHIQYYKPKRGFPVLHYERNSISPKRILAYMLYCNTVTDKGGTEFPYQNITLSAVKGNLIIWPAEFTHPHKGVISSTQEKYIVTGWFEII